ncbi:MAG: nucleotidyltransferase family protein [Candidatus Zixiibacteriota bacterium]
MEAIILAGGKGTRLQPYTSDIPKPLVPIGDTPVIEILLRHLKKAGVTRVHVAVNHLAHLVIAVLGDGSSLGLEIRYAIEDTPLSTAGPLTRIADLPEQFIVANGDILTDLDIAELFQFHAARRPLATIASHVRSEKVDFGVLQTDPSGRLTGFQEKPSLQFAVSMGIYVFSREILRYIPKDRPYGFDELMIDLIARGLPVMTFPFSGYWLDIGRPADYERALRDVDTIRAFSKGSI